MWHDSSTFHTLRDVAYRNTPTHTKKQALDYFHSMFALGLPGAAETIASRSAYFLGKLVAEVCVNCRGVMSHKWMGCRCVTSCTCIWDRWPVWETIAARTECFLGKLMAEVCVKCRGVVLHKWMGCRWVTSCTYMWTYDTSRHILPIWDIWPM